MTDSHSDALDDADSGALPKTPLDERASDDGCASNQGGQINEPPASGETLLHRSSRETILVPDSNSNGTYGLLQERPQEQLRVVPQLAVDRCIAGQQATAHLKLLNEGDTRLHCQLSSGEAWIEIEGTQAILLPGRAKKIPLTLDLTEQTPGLLSGTIKVSVGDEKSYVFVEATVEAPRPGELEILDQTIELGLISPAHPREFSISIENSGDTPLNGDINIVSEPACVTPVETRFSLSFHEQQCVDFTATGSEDLVGRGQLVQTISFRPDDGRQVRSAEVRFIVAHQPTPLLRCCAAMAVVGPIVLVPAFLGEFFSGLRPLSVILFMLSWLATSAAIAVFEWFWLEKRPDWRPLGVALGFLAVVWLFAPFADRAIRAVLGWILGLMIHETVVVMVTGTASAIAIGVAWLYCLFQSGQWTKNDVTQLCGYVLGAFGFGGLLRSTFQTLGRTYGNEEMIFADFPMLACLTLGLSIGLARATAEHNRWPDLPRLRSMSFIGVPALSCLIVLGVGLAIAGSQAHDALLTLDHWGSVCRLLFLRVH